MKPLLKLLFSRVHLIIFSFCFLSLWLFPQLVIRGQEPEIPVEVLPPALLSTSLPTETISQFRTETIQEEFTLPFSTVYEDSDELEIGKTQVVTQGQNGKLINTYAIEYYQEEESDKRLIKEERMEPETKKILRGTKIIWRETETENGTLKYWRKLKVYATAYTAESAGKAPGTPGFGITATGTSAHFGTVAVDPKVIPLGTKLYVAGYGYARAEDTGGAIKGNIIDLFYEGNHGWWPSSWTEVYLLD